MVVFKSVLFFIKKPVIILLIVKMMKILKLGFMQHKL